mgnify:FL=1
MQMKRIARILTVLALVSCKAGNDSSLRNREKAINNILSGMTMEEKIGQMILLEVNQVTHYDPALQYQSLMDSPVEHLDSLIRLAGLENTYDAVGMKAELAPDKLSTVYPFFLLSQNLNSMGGFRADEEKMARVFGEYHVGSLLNMLGGLEASSVSEWNQAISDLQTASVNYNGLPLLYGLDQVHGPTYYTGGTMFPHQIGMAATFNPELVKELGEMNAYETRAGGVRWVYGPSMDLGVRPGWSRFYETWGEDPYLTGVMATSYLEGLQGPDRENIDDRHVGACLKHYMGYGAPDSGTDRTPATITLQDLKEKHFAPFAKGREALSVMTNSSVVNGIPGVCNSTFLTDWYKTGLEWDGVFVTDWGDVEDLHRLYKVSTSTKESISLAVNAGIDMIMVPSSLDYGPLLKELVEEGKVSVRRIDDAVRRILRLKFRLGLFDEGRKVDYPDFGSGEFAEKALLSAIESEVLLKNDPSVLPIADGSRILVCGPNANSMRTLNGGWSYTWQGSNTEKFTEPYHTILQALQLRFGEDNVIYEPGVEYDFSKEWYEEKPGRISRAVDKARKADAIIVCAGENSYAETSGNLRDPELSESQKALVRALHKSGKPIVLVLNEGRPRLIRDIEPCCDAIIDIMLPGNYGGDALAALLSGDCNFSGKLPFTYPAYPQGQTTYYHKTMEERSTTPGIYNYENHADVQWWFGEGMSYTSFSYSDFRTDNSSFRSGDMLNFHVSVTNSGDRCGKETVMLFSSDESASVMPDNRRLRAFAKVELNPGETKEVTLSFPADDLSFVLPDGTYILEKGTFTFMAGGLYLDAYCKETHSTNHIL